MSTIFFGGTPFFLFSIQRHTVTIFVVCFPSTSIADIFPRDFFERQVCCCHADASSVVEQQPGLDGETLFFFGEHKNNNNKNHESIFHFPVFFSTKKETKITTNYQI